MICSYIPSCQKHLVWMFYNFRIKPQFLLPVSVVEVIELVLCVSLSVCLSCQLVSTLMAKPFEVWTPNLVQALTLRISRPSLIVKVKGQGHHIKKRDFWQFILVVLGTIIIPGKVNAREFCAHACKRTFRPNDCTLLNVGGASKLRRYFCRDWNTSCHMTMSSIISSMCQHPLTSTSAARI